MDPLDPCKSPNRALWRTVTELQQQNTELRVKVEQLKRSSSVSIVVPGSESVVGRESGKFLKMELEKERSGSIALKQQLDVALVGSAAKDEQLAECQAALAARDEQVAEFQKVLAAKDEQLAEFQAALAAKEEQAAAQCEGNSAAEGEQLPEGQAALAAKEEELSSCQAALAATEEQLAGCQTALAASDEQLTACQASLAAQGEQLSSCQASLADKEAQLAACQAALLDREGELAEAHRELWAAQGQVTAKEGELAAALRQLQGARSLAQFTEGELNKCRQQLQEYEAKVLSQERELEGARREAKRVQQAQVAHLGATAQLEEQTAAAARAVAAATGQQAGTPTASPTASLGAKSDGGYSPVGSYAAGGTSPPAPYSVRLSAAPRTSTTTVFNVMVDGSGMTEDAAVAAELERLTHQVVSLQDKLEALQAVHEKLLGDYSSVTEQLAARQAEAQMARLSPESGQLKQQVQGLQEQVAVLQQELFHYHMQSIADSISGRGSPTGSAGLGPANNTKEGRSTKRSFSRAASSIGQRLLHPLRRQKSTASLGPGLVDSRANSLTESMTSVHSCSMAVQSLQHSMHSSPGAGSVRFSPGASPLAGALGLLTPAEGSPGASPRLAGASLFASPALAGLEPDAAALLVLRQQLAERCVEVDSLQARLGAEVQRAEQMQEALTKQGIELQEVSERLAQARQALAGSAARLGEVEALAAEMQAGVPPVAAECQLPGGAEHTRCREAADHLTRQVWRERMARQKVEYQLEQERSRASRQSEASEVDESLLERLQAEAQAADTMSAELQKARGHQLQLQQRVEALQLQLAKQTALLESATRGGGAVTLAGARTGSPFRSPRSPSKADMEKHNMLRVAELKAEDATLKLALSEREVTRLQRQERRLNQALSQAAEWRKRAERVQEENSAAWKRRLEREKTAVAQLESRLRMSVQSQQGLLSGLEALQALLQTKSPGGGSPPTRRTTAPYPSSPSIAPLGAVSASVTQEALRQVSSLLRKCTFRLQQCSSDLLSPQHSHSEGDSARSSAIKTGGGDSPGPGHQLLSVKALAPIPAERLSEPAEPLSPRGRGPRPELQRRSSLTKLRPPQQPTQEQGQGQGQEQAEPAEGPKPSGGHVASPEPAAGEGPRAWAAAAVVAAPAAAESWPEESGRSSGGGDLIKAAVAAPVVPEAAPALPEVVHSSFRLPLPEGSRRSMMVLGIELGRASLSSVSSDCVYDPDARLPPRSRALSSAGQRDKDMRIPAHRPSNGLRSGGGEQPPKPAAASPKAQGKQAGGGGGGSPRLKAFMGALKRSVGLGCKDSSTLSGKASLAQAAAKAVAASPRRSSTGVQQSGASPRRSSTGMRDSVHEGGRARSPRKAWL